ncbi:baseplate wedge tail fiber protein connector [Vibrio phage EniLVp02]
MGLKRLNTGEVGVPGTGDTVNAGGIKLRDSFDELYLTFGDVRLEGVIKQDDEEWIRPHATGYYQHLTFDQIQSAPLKAGGLYDINSRLSPFSDMVVNLPRISERLPDDINERVARRGETIVIQDSAGSWYGKSLRLVPHGSDLIEDSPNMEVSESLKVVTLTVVSRGGVLQWSARVDDIDGTEGNAIVDTSIEILPGVIGRIPLASVGAYDAMKFSLYVEEYDPDTTMTTNWSASELLTMHDDTTAHVVPFATMETADLYTLTVEIQAGYVYLNITPETTRRLTVTLKSQSVIKRTDVFRSPVVAMLPIRYASGGWVSNSTEIQYTTKSTVSKQVQIQFDVE